MVNEKMTAIADAIRSKTGGTEKLGLDAMASSIDEVYDKGKQAEYDTFWDYYQENGNRQSYDLAFGGVGWSNGNIFKPKYKIYPTRAYRMFESSTLTDLSKVDMDFSRCSYFVQAFTGSSVTKLGVIDTRGASYAGFLLDSAKQLVSIEKVILKDDGSQTLASSFTNLNALQSITFEGVIGDNVSFQHSGSLSKASVQNIIDHLKSGVAKTVTFHTNVKAMVEADNELLGKITSKNWTLA